MSRRNATMDAFRGAFEEGYVQGAHHSRGASLILEAQRISMAYWERVREEAEAKFPSPVSASAPSREAGPGTPEVKRGVYIASRSMHGARWRDLRDSGFPVCATWINESEQGQTGSWPDLWWRCVDEASECAALILYAPIEDGELKGALVEVGAALASGRPVYFVGDGEARRYSWLNHPNVVECDAVEEAMALALADCSRPAAPLASLADAIDLSSPDSLRGTWVAETEALRTEVAALRSSLQEAPRDVLIRGADRMARELDGLVRSGVISARSCAADALLDYADSRFGSSDPLGQLRTAPLVERDAK
jgi:hypothetical protein